MSESWSEPHLSALLEHSQDIIIVVDETGTISFINAAARRMLGYDPDELIGRNAFEFIHEEDRDRVFERFMALIESPGSSTDRVQHRMVDRDGQSFWVESIGSNQTETDLDGYVINTRNISEIKENEAELTRQNELLNEFASVVSHDIRNPLNVAQARLTLAADDCDSAHLEDVSRALERIESILEDLLVLARAGEVVSNIQVVELSELVEAAWMNVKTDSAELDVTTDRSIEADESRVKQLLENLIRNAVEHGGSDVTVTVGDLPGGFYVADDGRGIPEDEWERVTEPGYSTSDTGTGFGLNIVQQIVDAHDWRLRVTESDAGGARFEITQIDLVA